MHIIKARIADWNHTEDRTLLRAIRERVFIDEQKVPVELEWDEFDANSTHFLALLDNRYAASARLKADGQLGRMAVLAEFRQRGVGSALLHFIIQQAKKPKLEKLYCHAQVSAIEFYQQHGFVAYGKEFDDAGIPHRAMQLILTDKPS